MKLALALSNSEAEAAEKQRKAAEAVDADDPDAAQKALDDAVVAAAEVNAAAAAAAAAAAPVMGHPEGGVGFGTPPDQDELQETQPASQYFSNGDGEAKPDATAGDEQDLDLDDEQDHDDDLDAMSPARKERVEKDRAQRAAIHAIYGTNSPTHALGMGASPPKADAGGGGGAAANGAAVEEEEDLEKLERELEQEMCGE